VPLIDSVIALPFRIGSALRGARVFHPQGFLCRGRWEIATTSASAPSAHALTAGSGFDCLVRVSRGAGLPEGLPDFLGFAIRLLDAYGADHHQDLLINASADLPVVHHLFLPAPRWYAQSYSTCLPYRAGAGLVLIGLLPPAVRGPRPSLEAMRRATEGTVTLGVAISTLLGRWERIGTLRLQDPLDPGAGDVDFDPWNTGGGLQPATWLNRLRREAYRQSRLGRGAPSEPRLQALTPVTPLEPSHPIRVSSR
jgi:hypothetical protein